MNTSITPTIGGRPALATRVESGFTFCRQSLEINDQPRHIVAVWKCEASPQNAPVYLLCIDGTHQTTASLLGFAVLALEHLGIGRPRLGTIQRVAGAFAEMMQPQGF